MDEDRQKLGLYSPIPQSPGWQNHAVEECEFWNSGGLCRHANRIPEAGDRTFHPDNLPVNRGVKVSSIG